MASSSPCFMEICRLAACVLHSSRFPAPALPAASATSAPVSIVGCASTGSMHSDVGLYPDVPLIRGCRPPRLRSGCPGCAVAILHARGDVVAAIASRQRVARECRRRGLMRRRISLARTVAHGLADLPSERRHARRAGRAHRAICRFERRLRLVMAQSPENEAATYGAGIFKRRLRIFLPPSGCDFLIQHYQ